MPVNEFFLLALITSLKILFVWAAMKDGMILHWLAVTIDKCISGLPPMAYLALRKPLYDCLFCMASIYGILFTIPYVEISFEYLGFLMTVAGLNYLIQWVITSDDVNA